MAKQSKRNGRSRVRPDGRKQLLVYLPVELIKELKVAALNEGRHMYLLTEDSIRSYLKDKQSSRKGRF